jgi:hypothetical protein
MRRPRARSKTTGATRAHEHLERSFDDRRSAGIVGRAVRAVSRGARHRTRRNTTGPLDLEHQSSIWSVSVNGGSPRLLVRFDNPSRRSLRREFATDGRRFYFTIARDESDIWALELLKSEGHGLAGSRASIGAQADCRMKRETGHLRHPEPSHAPAVAEARSAQADLSAMRSPAPARPCPPTSSSW